MDNNYRFKAVLRSEMGRLFKAIDSDQQNYVKVSRLCRTIARLMVLDGKLADHQTYWLAKAKHNAKWAAICKADDIENEVIEEAAILKRGYF